MARKYAQVKVSIWIDDGFLALSDSAQALYFRLLTAPRLNFCGVSDWRPRRLALLAAGLTEKKVQASADELASANYVIYDADSEEILIRSFIRHDGVLASPNLATALANDYADIHSKKLRQVVLGELTRLYQEQPDLKGWERVADLLQYGDRTLSGSPSDTLQDTLPDTLSPPTPIYLLPTPTPVTPTATPAAVAESFEIWYSVYPKKIGRPVALKSYQKALTKTDVETLLVGARFMANKHKHDKTYCPNPATWLNQERWTDEIITEQPEPQFDSLGFIK